MFSKQFTSVNLSNKFWSKSKNISKKKFDIDFRIDLKFNFIILTLGGQVGPLDSVSAR